MSTTTIKVIEGGRTLGDLSAAGGVAASWLGWLPPVAAGCAIIWFGIRFFEYVRWVRRGRPGPMP